MSTSTDDPIPGRTGQEMRHIVGHNYRPNDQGRMNSTLAKETVSIVRDEACLSVLFEMELLGRYVAKHLDCFEHADAVLVV